MKKKINKYQLVIDGLMRKHRFTLNWNEKNRNYPVNINSYTEARDLAITCKTCGYFAYCETKYDEPYLVHIEANPVHKQTYIPL